MMLNHHNQRTAAYDFELCLPPLPSSFKWVIPAVLFEPALTRFLCEFKPTGPHRRLYLSCYIDRDNALGFERDRYGHVIPYIECYAVGFSNPKTQLAWAETTRIRADPSNSESQFEAQRAFDNLVEQFCQEVLQHVRFPSAIKLESF